MSDTSDTGSITEWLTALKAGDPDPAQRIWVRYLDRLIQLANQRLGGAARRMADEEDIVVSAFAAFLQAVESKKFNELKDREDLWQILLMLTERKAIDQMRQASAKKRGDGRVVGESVFEKLSMATGYAGIDEVEDAQPTPEFAAQATEALRQLLEQLEDAELQKIAIAKMEGYTNAEIAVQHGKSLSSIERKLRLIRQLWTRAPQ